MHRPVEVIHLAVGAGKVEATVERLLAPFEGREWDWWTIGGRWNGYPTGLDLHPNKCWPVGHDERTVGNTVPVAGWPDNEIPINEIVTPDGVWHKLSGQPTWQTKWTPAMVETARRDRAIIHAAWPGCQATVVDLHD